MFNLLQLLKQFGQGGGMGQPQMGQPMGQGSQGVFGQYMQNAFMPQFQPPVIPGNPGSVKPTGGGVFGFTPNMPAMPKPATAVKPKKGMKTGGIFHGYDSYDDYWQSEGGGY